MKFQVEHTDTFGGQANYCWATRKTIEAPSDISDSALTRLAKAALGMTGVRCDREEWGETIALRPRRLCQIIFITPEY